MIAIINYGMGNLRSVEKALNKIGIPNIITNKKDEIDTCSHIILPGVGAFGEGMTNLNNLELVDFLRDQVLNNGKKLIGICLGMQLLFKNSEENPGVDGFGLIDGEVVRFDLKDLRVPHIGWNNVFSDTLSDNNLYSDIANSSDFYFVHSFHASLNGSESDNLTYTDYGYDFVSSINVGNVYGVQFHPEKSQKKGLQMLKNFYEKC